MSISLFNTNNASVYVKQVYLKKTKVQKILFFSSESFIALSYKCDTFVIYLYIVCFISLMRYSSHICAINILVKFMYYIYLLHACMRYIFITCMYEIYICYMHV